MRTVPRHTRHSLKALHVLLWLSAAGVGCAPVAAEDVAAQTEAKRPRIALVLSGGGARGLAHVGVVDVLQQNRIPIDCVVGTSMGALVGGAYAAGVTPETMKERLAKTDINAMFDDEPPRSQIPQRIKRDDYRPLFGFTLGYNDGQIELPTGVSAGYKFELFLRNLVGQGASVSNLDFDKLPTPFRAVATDLETGRMQVFVSGDLAKSMRASMSLPAIVAPTEINGHLYVDGGLVRNLPVDIGRQLCGDVVIAVNLGTPLLKRNQIHNVIDVASQSLHLMMEHNVLASLSELNDRDVLIEPRLDGFKTSSFSDSEAIVARGNEAATAVLPKLAHLALDEKAYGEWLAQRESRIPPPVQIANIRIEASKGFNPKAVEHDLRVKTGEGFSIAELDNDIALIYGRADFSYLGYSVVTGPDGATLVIDAQSKPWGPGYLKLGLGATTDFTSPTQLNVAAGYRRTWANSLGGEWRVDAQMGYDSFLGTEFLQPLQVRDGAFVAPYAYLERTFAQYYYLDDRLGQYRIHKLGGGVDVGLTSPAGELRLGPYFMDASATPDFGIANFVVPEEESTAVGLRASGIMDWLDSTRFPRSGWFAAADVRAARRDYRSEDQYSRGELALRGVKSFGKNTFSLHLEAGKNFEGELTIYDSFKLGGPMRMSGLFLDQLTGSRYDLATLSYYRQYARLPTEIGRGAYLGFSLETGRIDDPLMKDPWDRMYSGSVFWGADTVIGAIYLGYGHSTLDQGTFYLMIGPTF